MGQRRDEWVDIFRALGEAFFAVLRSEWDVVRHSWSGALRNILLAVIYFVVAGVFAILLVLLLTTAAVLYLHGRGFSPWAATLIVAGTVVGIMLILVSVAYFLHLRHFKNPIATAKQSFADHMHWWREHLLHGDVAVALKDREGDEHG